MSSRFNQLYFLSTRQFFDPNLPFERRAFVGVVFGITYPFCATGSGIFRPFAALVLLEPFFDIGGDASVERAVGAFEYIDEVGSGDHIRIIAWRRGVFVWYT